MDSLSKAFAYIGTTLEDDRKVAKRLSCWDPDEDVVAPHLDILRHTLHIDEAQQLTKVQKELFMNCRNFRSDLGYNICDSLWHTCFSTVLIHAHVMLQFKENAIAFAIYRACSEAGCDVKLLLKAGSILREKLVSL
jgi:hypothetical protein